jgi:hypothetical protein
MSEHVGCNCGDRFIASLACPVHEPAPETPAVTLLDKVIPMLSWEYVGEELAVFWNSPYGAGKEKIASFWWPSHPPEKTSEVESIFEAIATRLTKPALQREAELTALIDFLKSNGGVLVTNGVCDCCHRYARSTNPHSPGKPCELLNRGE